MPQKKVKKCISEKNHSKYGDGGRCCPCYVIRVPKNFKKPVLVKKKKKKPVEEGHNAETVIVEK